MKARHKAHLVIFCPHAQHAHVCPHGTNTCNIVNIQLRQVAEHSQCRGCLRLQRLSVTCTVICRHDNKDCKQSNMPVKGLKQFAVKRWQCSVYMAPTVTPTYRLNVAFPANLTLQPVCQLLLQIHQLQQPTKVNHVSWRSFKQIKQRRSSWFQNAREEQMRNEKCGKFQATSSGVLAVSGLVGLVG